MVTTMKKLIILAMVCLLVLSVGCNNTTESFSETSSSVSDESSTVFQDPDVVEGYLLIIDHLVNYQSGLNNRDRYLAIDTSKIVNLTPDGKIRLIKSLEKYNLQVLNKTLDELEKEGYLQGYHFENGLLIIIEDEKMVSNSITLNASRYRVNLNAYGLLDFRIRFVSGHWEMDDICITWVS